MPRAPTGFFWADGVAVASAASVTVAAICARGAVVACLAVSIGIVVGVVVVVVVLLVARPVPDAIATMLAGGHDLPLTHYFYLEATKTRKKKKKKKREKKRERKERKRHGC